MGKNETQTLKEPSDKAAFLVPFLTLSRYCLALTLVNSVSLNIFISYFSLTVLLRVVEIVSLEKVTIILY